MSEQRRTDAHDDFLIDDEDNEDTQANKYLFFRIGKESYGVGIRHVIEIIELQPISAVPDMPSYVKGVINLRGKVIPIVDLRLRFRIDERDYDNRTCIIVTEVERVQVGFVVDTVEEVLEIPEKNIEPPPKFRTMQGQDRYLSGMAKSGESIKILVDVEKLVQDENLGDSVLAQTAESPSS
ncbi:chemotaxis protein CheW [Treponema zuelzerae]|uniref:Chemotaxis protein CheW n=1 Tax=Teretinema zuelzerae TaxID=156 RepID=A0AAE3JHD8_9SPIR|nr:chemotaxis protein CheW [Teretinema zuelzerae]MCD1653652.1 chemotaxis protein CheW [Teretinema zuelzerae]